MLIILYNLTTTLGMMQLYREEIGDVLKRADEVLQRGSQTATPLSIKDYQQIHIITLNNPRWG